MQKTWCVSEGDKFATSAQDRKEKMNQVATMAADNTPHLGEHRQLVAVLGKHKEVLCE